MHNDNSQLKSDLQKAHELVRKLTEENNRQRHDIYHWRQAVRYEQALKRPRKKVRHLPLYNEVQRAKRRDTPVWIGCRTNAERVYLSRWRKENKDVPGFNGGHGVLQLLLSEDSNEYAATITQRDATVAATVIQWLGTNCGHAFMHETEREIARLRDAENKRRVAI